MKTILRIFAGAKILSEPKEDSQKIKIAIVGAGRTGVSLAEELFSNTMAMYVPICFVDVNKDKVGRSIHGIPVLMNDDSIFNQLKQIEVQEIVFAIHELDADSKKCLYIEPCGVENKSRRVKNYKDYLYDLSRIDDSEVKKADFGTTIYSAAKEMFLNREIYRGLPKEILIGIANNEYGLNKTDDTANCSEYAKEELIRRGIDLQPNKGKQ